MPIEGRTLPEAFYRIVQRKGDRDFMFSKEGGEWKAMTYNQALDLALRTMAGLQALGVESKDKVCLFAENRKEWMVTDYAIQWLDAATTAIYLTSSDSQVEYILNHSEAKVLMLGKDVDVEKIKAQKNLQHLKAIVCWDKLDLPSEVAGVPVISREEFLKEKISVEEAESLLAKVAPDDLAILLYTSGTTGEPKGVMLSQNNLLSNIKMMEQFLNFADYRRTLSFLPLCHIYERSVLQVSIFTGLEVYFAESIDKLVDNMQEVRPHIMTAVPRIFEKIYAKVIDKVKNAPAIKKNMFYSALWVGKQTFDYRIKHEPMPFYYEKLFAVADKLVFSKIRALFGGEAQLFISGGAPLSREIAEFFFQAGFRILEGYGLSETCIYGANPPKAIKFGTVGKAFDNVTVKIAEDGEILLGGPSIMLGYYKKPDETAQVMTDDGFFKTGDIGEIDADGYLKITDRKKELIITAGGKNVAPQPIENRLKEDAMMESVCLIGDRRKYLSALVVPNLEMCQSWANHKGLKLESLNDCVNSPELKAHFQKHIDRINEDLPKYSTIKKFALLAQPFTIETGELTPTMKLKRRIINEKFQPQIDQLYS